METVTKLKAWGNSVGIILPKEKLKQENLKQGDVVDVVIHKKSIFREMYGALKGIPPSSPKSTDELLKEIDEEFASRYD